MTMTIINWLIDISLWQYVCFMLSPLVINFFTTVLPTINLTTISETDVRPHFLALTYSQLRTIVFEKQVTIIIL